MKRVLLYILSIIFGQKQYQFIERIRKFYFRSVLNSLGNASRIEKGVRIKPPENVSIENGSFLGRDTALYAFDKIIIGNNVLIAPGVILLTRNHLFSESSNKTIREQGYEYAPITIEDDVWIGIRAIILPGVKIGQGAIIGADDVKILRLVYIGGVNRHRGVIETAQYVSKFNTNSNDKKLEFTVYSPDHEIIRELVKQGALQHIHWIDYDKLMAELSNYDIGTCLLLPIKKFYRNLPVKNFDYMSQGLPFITSNFGNLAKYVILSGGGVCVNPKSYLEFENAIMPMFEGNYRRRLGERGYDWVRREGNFELEGANYVKIFSSIDHQL
jgi:acetyltransferase-like isoleucine patch superfamily enzyme